MDVAKLPVFLGCSCSFWRYYGPDYWARHHGFLEGPSRSNGQRPVVRDPHEENWACKHVLSASKIFKNYSLKRGPRSTPPSNQNKPIRTPSTVRPMDHALHNAPISTPSPVLSPLRPLTPIGPDLNKTQIGQPKRTGPF